MQKIGFLASFFAVFLTMDIQIFDGAVTRYSWNVASEAVHDTKAKVGGWVRRL